MPHNLGSRIARPWRRAVHIVEGDLERRPDVALFVRDLYFGGTERYAVTLANAFAALGLNVDLVGLWGRGALKDELAPSVRVVELRRRNAFRSLLPLMRYMRVAKPRAFIAGTPAFNLVAVWARLLARHSGRVIVVEHNTVSLRSRGRLRKRIKLPTMALTYRLADHVVAVSEGVADDLARSIWLDRARIRVIYNPFDVAGIREKAGEPVDHPWLVERDKPVVLGVGRMTLEKDFEGLVRAFAVLRKSVDARLFLVGDGPERKRVEALVDELGIRDRVFFAGLDPNPFRYMARADLFVLSSKVEGFSRVLVEAMACGVPVVSTDCPSGPREILGDGEYGQLTPLANARDLAAAMLTVLMLPPTERATLALNGQRRAEVFSSESAVRDFVSLCTIGASR